jgi:hypothetical protein
MFDRAGPAICQLRQKIEFRRKQYWITNLHTAHCRAFRVGLLCHCNDANEWSESQTIKTVDECIAFQWMHSNECMLLGSANDANEWNESQTIKTVDECSWHSNECIPMNAFQWMHSNECMSMNAWMQSTHLMRAFIDGESVIGEPTEP